MNDEIRLPGEFLRRMRLLLKDEFDSFTDSYKAPSYRGLRFNTLKVPADRYDELFRTACGTGTVPDRVPWCIDGFYFGDDVRPGIHPYHAAGLYYIQEPSAMLPGALACDLIGQVIADKGFVKVLDMCAAPGGKATQAACRIGAHGILVANEPIPGRARILSQNIERMGIRNTLTVCEMPDRLASVFPGFFDIVIVDAPCSGEGMFRKDETAVAEWSPENVDACVARGRDILRAAHECLKPGGHIVYSTCTYEPAENEDAVNRFIDEHPSYKIITPAAAGLTPSVDGTYRLWPHKIRGEGHFAAVLKEGDVPDSRRQPDTVKTGASETDEAPKLTYARGVTKEAVKLLEQFVTDTLNDRGKDILSGHVFTYGDNVYMIPEELASYVTGADKKRALRTERPGLHLGELKKGRFEPSHSLAMALSGDMGIRDFDMAADDERVLKYLRGESLPCDAGLKGYVLVTADGFPIGWGKASGGTLKNHYPKGLRYPVA